LKLCQLVAALSVVWVTVSVVPLWETVEAPETVWAPVGRGEEAAWVPGAATKAELTARPAKAASLNLQNIPALRLMKRVEDEVAGRGVFMEFERVLKTRRCSWW
jgi:hypothetical protein